MAIGTLEELLLHEVKDLFHAEKQLLKALPKMVSAATHPDLKDAFEEHLQQTEGQVRRLEQAFKLLGVPAKGKKCEGMAGLLEEGRKVMEADAEPAVLDAALIAAAQKVEHYEIASYGCVCTYAELLGYGTTNDAYHMVTPLPSGEQAARAISLALADGGLRPADVDYVNAHGSSTPLGDRAEALAIRQALGPAAGDALVSATKPLYGHPLGASGAIETAITALALDCGFLPATPNLRSPSPDVALRHVPPGGLRARARYALNNACGFGGINACLALGAWHASPSAMS